MPVGRGGGINSVGVKGGKNKETVTASLCLMFTVLVAPAAAKPDWCKGQQSLSEESRALTTHYLSQNR